MRGIELYDFQADARDAVRRELATHSAVMLNAPTGSGKTVIGIDFAERTLANGKRCWFVCDRRNLVNQTSNRFESADVKHGILMQGVRFQSRYKVQIVSYQTFISRMKMNADDPLAINWRGLADEVDVMIFDEAHTLYNGIGKEIERRKELERRDGKRRVTLGFSATCFVPGCGNDWDAVVNASTTRELMQQGYLCPFDVFCATMIDTDRIRKTSSGEWDEESSAEVAADIIGDIPRDWLESTKRVFPNEFPVKTLAFVPTVDYAHELSRRFREEYGVDFRVGSYRDDPTQSETTINEFMRGECVGLISVEKFVKGFDVPDVKCLISARPYRKSLAGHIQQLGRVMRTAPGKDIALILDHTGNYAGFQEDTNYLFRHGVTKLVKKGERKPQTRRKFELKDVKCSGCGFLLEPSDKECPSCGKERPRRQHRIRTATGEMIQFSRVDATNCGGSDDREYVWRHLVRCGCAIPRRPRWDESDPEVVKRLDTKAKWFARYRFIDLYGEPPPKQWWREWKRDNNKPDPQVRELSDAYVKAFKRRGGFKDTQQQAAGIVNPPPPDNGRAVAGPAGRSLQDALEDAVRNWDFGADRPRESATPIPAVGTPIDRPDQETLL